MGWLRVYFCLGLSSVMLLCWEYGHQTFSMHGYVGDGFRRAQCTSKSRMTISRVAMMPQNIGCLRSSGRAASRSVTGRAWLHSVQPHSQLAIVLVEMCGSFGGAGLCQSNGVIERAWGLRASDRPIGSVFARHVRLSCPRRALDPQGRLSRTEPTSERNATWLILPVVICLSQRLSHACVR
ncbi:unnamed protein product [Prunus brigantina]